MKEKAEELGVSLDCRQTNHEGVMLDLLQSGYDGAVVNAGAYTHTSIALMDCIQGMQLPTVEVHITDITKREDFRQVSYLGKVCIARVMGKGFAGYEEALDILVAYLHNKKKES